MYRKIIIETINRVYAGGLTTTSGGNLSVRDEEGNIYITPSSKDKGTLEERDVCKVTPDKRVEGLYKPSIELPFHSLIYDLRPDVRAVLHVHSPYLVAFSLLNSKPETGVLPLIGKKCGEAGLSLYDIPGSIELGRQIAEFIKTGYDSVMMQNHGVVLVAGDMYEAYERLELLENAAKICLYARLLGNVKTLGKPQIDAYFERAQAEILAAVEPSDGETALRRSVCDFSRRCYVHGLFNCADGVISAKCGDGFLITPARYDRAALKPEEIVFVKDGKAFGGTPDMFWKAHADIYAKTDVGGIMQAAPPCVGAYAATGTKLTSRTIPESYIMMRDMTSLPFDAGLGDCAAVVGAIKPANPVVLVENAFVLATGENITKAFDRLEVSETTAKNLLLCKILGAPIEISDAEIEKIDRCFALPQNE